MSATMIRHQANRDFFQYWNAVRAHAPAPDQKAMDPARIGEALPDVFIVDVAPSGEYEMRLAGTRLCAMWGTELRGMDALALWEGEDREGAEMLFHSVLEDGAVAVASLEVVDARGQAVELEMVAMPLLRSHGQAAAPSVKRIIGAFTPWQHPFWLGQAPIQRQRIVSVRMVWPEEASRVDGLSLVGDTKGEHHASLAPRAFAAPHLHAARSTDRVGEGADVLAHGVPQGATGEDAVNGMPVLGRRAHLTLLKGGNETSG